VITQGLQPGEEVVTDGVDRLSDGMAVTIAKPPPAVAAGGFKHRHWKHSGTPPASE
jgi:hypothetical protein